MLGRAVLVMKVPSRWGDSHMIQTGCSSEILNSTPKRDQSGRGSSFLCPLKDTKNTKNIIDFSLFLRVQPLTRPLWLKILKFCPRHPKRDQTSEIYTPEREDEHPRLFHKGVPPPPPPPGVPSTLCICYVNLNLFSNPNCKQNAEWSLTRSRATVYDVLLPGLLYRVWLYYNGQVFFNKWWSTANFKKRSSCSSFTCAHVCARECPDLGIVALLVGDGARV